MRCCHCCLGGGGQPHLEPGGPPPPQLGLPAAVSQAPVPSGGGMCGLAEERGYTGKKVSLVVEPSCVFVICLLRIIFSMSKNIGSGTFRTLGLLVREDSSHPFFHKGTRPPPLLLSKGGPRKEASNTEMQSSAYTFPCLGWVRILGFVVSCPLCFFP